MTTMLKSLKENKTTQSNAQKSAKKPTLLLVDDEASFHRRFVGNFDYWQVKSAYNAQESLRLVRRKPPVLAVIDLSFDGGSTYGGLDLIAQIHYECPNLPIIAISKFILNPSGHEGNLLSDLALKVGATCFLSKAHYSVAGWQDVFMNILSDTQLPKRLQY